MKESQNDFVVELDVERGHSNAAGNSPSPVRGLYDLGLPGKHLTVIIYVTGLQACGSKGTLNRGQTFFLKKTALRTRRPCDKVEISRNLMYGNVVLIGHTLGDRVNDYSKSYNPVIDFNANCL